MKFAVTDIKNFYPFVTQDLLNKALNFASESIYISKCDIDIVHLARKSLLFNSSHNWIKKQGDLFDVSMRSHDRAKVYEVLGTYMLNLLSKKNNKKDFGLYRKDGSAIEK